MGKSWPHDSLSLQALFAGLLEGEQELFGDVPTFTNSLQSQKNEGAKVFEVPARPKHWGKLAAEQRKVRLWPKS